MAEKYAQTGQVAFEHVEVVGDYDNDEKPRGAQHGGGHNFDEDVFGHQRDAKDGDYLEFRSLGWFKAGLLACAEFLAIGMLSFPSIFMRLGMVGGVLATVGFAGLAYIMAWVIVDFKCRHMGVMNYADAGEMMFGRAGFWVFAAMLVVKSMFLAGSHVVVGAQAFAIMTNNRACNVWWGLLVTVLSVLCSIPREWNRLGLLSLLSVSCIVVASIMTTIVTGLQDPAVLTKGGPAIQWHAVNPDPSFLPVLGGITNVIFSFGGAQAIFAFTSEMRQPRAFKKSFAMSMSFGAVMQGVVGAVIYSFGGQYTTSPALSMMNHKFQIAAYSIAMVTILVSGVVAVNVGVKFLYVNVLRDSPLLTSLGWRARGIWIAFVLLHWIAGFVIAELIPFFNNLLTIITALTSVWFSYGFCGFLWFYDNHPRLAKPGEQCTRSLSSWRAWWWISVSVLSILLSCVITPLGMYSAAIGIRDGYKNGQFNHPFAC